jgi:branched-chain amino acid transport system permease protein
MFEVFGVSSQALFGQLLIGLINGSFYALLSLGLAVIFGMLNIINFVHGAQYMLGAFAAIFLLQYAELGYSWALVIAPLVVGATGIVVERLFLRWLYQLDHLYGLLLTFGLALIIEGVFRNFFGSSGLPYSVPPSLTGGQNLDFMFLPNYRAWVIAASLTVCLATWFVIERTKLGAYLRAATENPTLVRAFGINVPRMITLTYGFGVALAALAGVMAAPIYNVSPQMGANLIIVVFAVVVIGGMGSILGAIVTGFGLGLIEGLTKVFFPEASNTVIFVVMTVVPIRPAGLFDGARKMVAAEQVTLTRPGRAGASACISRDGVDVAVLPVFVYRCSARGLVHTLFACAFNLLPVVMGLLSFGAAVLRLAVISGNCQGGAVRPYWAGGGNGSSLLPPLSLELAILAAPRRHSSGPDRRLDRDPPAGHLLRDDYTSFVDDVLLCSAGTIHAWRGRHSGSAARALVRRRRSVQPDQHVHHRRSDLRCIVPDDLPHHQFAVRRGAQSDP